MEQRRRNKRIVGGRKLGYAEGVERRVKINRGELRTGREKAYRRG